MHASSDQLIYFDFYCVSFYVEEISRLCFLSILQASNIQGTVCLYNWLIEFQYNNNNNNNNFRKLVKMDAWLPNDELVRWQGE